ncbi:hypothetical protein HDU89_001352, partial [Geranomyces variabilis]
MPPAAYTATALPNITLSVTVYVDAGTALEMRHDGKIVTGFVGTPRRVAFVIISSNSSVVPVEGNPADDITTDAVVRRYTIPPQDTPLRRCPGAVVVMEGSDLRGKTPEP